MAGRERRTRRSKHCSIQSSRRRIEKLEHHLMLFADVIWTNPTLTIKDAVALAAAHNCRTRLRRWLQKIVARSFSSAGALLRRHVGRARRPDRAANHRRHDQFAAGHSASRSSKSASPCREQLLARISRREGRHE